MRRGTTESSPRRGGVRRAPTSWTSRPPTPACGSWRGSTPWPGATAVSFGLSEKRNTPFGKLSGIQKQRLSIALALVGNPEVAVLDELTTGLDPLARRETWGLIEKIRAGGVTVLLVTHFMDEAERLCDRLAVIDSGRVVALDTPAGLITRANAEQRVRFRPSAPFDERLLRSLPEVSGVSRRRDEVLVTGTGHLLQTVTDVLARHDVAAVGLQHERATLEDAFVALTGRKADEG